jgi:hypothetical protein
MNADNLQPEVLLARVSDRFRRLIRNLIRGNTKKACSLVEKVREDMLQDGERIAFQNFIEAMAQEQAVRNAVINIPSVVPVLGTIISIGLMSLEDFYILDQGVRVILALSYLHGVDMQDETRTEEMVIGILAESYGLNFTKKETGGDAVIKRLMIALVPQKYVNMGVSRGVKRFLKRLLPFRRRSRLLPVGFGLIMSAVNAYEIIVKTGQLTLKYLAAERHLREKQ